MGSLYRKPGGLVFANEAGGIVDPSNLRNRSFPGFSSLPASPHNPLPRPPAHVRHPAALPQR